MHEKDIGNPRFCIHLDTKTRIDLNVQNGTSPILNVNRMYPSAGGYKTVDSHFSFWSV
jgi:hypothetical protein